MKWIFGYDSLTESVILDTGMPDDVLWHTFVCLLGGDSFSIKQKGDQVRIPIRTFLGLRVKIAQFIRNHDDEISTEFTDEIRNKLKEVKLNSYPTAIATRSLSDSYVLSRLAQCGFERPLTVNQLHNVCRLAPLPAGATFSVPGAGKTTEALAYFFLNAKPEDRLLVVAPKNTFGAWEEQFDACLPREKEKFVRLGGGYDRIDSQLRDNPRFMLIGYQQYCHVSSLIKRHLEQHHVFMFLDESHRIKSGKHGVSPELILSVSYLPKRKLIMSGTPMPQSTSDLLPQFSFLYPDKVVDTDTVVDCIQPIYVRTTKDQLGIPPIDLRTIALDMTPLQKELYATLRSEMKRQVLPMLTDESRFSLREIGKRMMKIVEFVSNPSLLANDLEFVFDQGMGEILAENNGPKIEYACKKARELAAVGQKVIIWSQFVKNDQLISERLQDIGADYIIGSVDTGNEDEEYTREWKIREFHNNRDKMVLVLNPAAASEGISLHTICHHAIYVDRSFNAAQYLQSEDRIHRLGLRTDEGPVIEILECKNSIDQVIDQRLRTKVDAMSKALNDSSLEVDPIPYDVDIDPDDEITAGDIAAIKKYFEGPE